MFAKKLVISFWLLIISLFITPVVFAQTSTPSAITQPTTYQLPTNISPTSPIFTDMLVNNIFHSFSCLAIGQSTIGQPCLTYQVTKNAQGAIQSVPVLSQVNLSGGVLGTTTSLIGALYDNRPVRSIDYLASVGQDLGIVKEANAQVIGSGAAVLNPILTLWQVSRNISYLIMIIIFVIIGLMVMFRNRINPQTVITAQAALPGLVIGLILITFSYFLAGLIADTAFIGTNIVGAYFSAVKEKPPEDLAKNLSDNSVLYIFGNFLGGFNQGTVSSITRQVYDSMPDSVKNWIRVLAGIIAFQFGSSFGGPLGTLAGSVGCTGLTAGLGTPIAPFCGLIGQIFGQATAGTIAAGIAAADPGGTIAWPLYFIALAALIYAMLILLLRLINSFLTIIFLTISAPFQFLFASLPGRQGIATGWIMNLLGNVLVFPAVIAVFYFVAFILETRTGPLNVSSLNKDNLVSMAYAAEQIKIVNKDTFPLFGGLQLDFIKFLLAFGALMASPAIPNIVIKAVGKISEAGQLLGQEIGASIGQGQRYSGMVTSVPGQAGGAVGRIGEQAGAKYQVISTEGGPVLVKTPGFAGALRGQVPTIVGAGKPPKGPPTGIP